MSDSTSVDHAQRRQCELGWKIRRPSPETSIRPSTPNPLSTRNWENPQAKDYQSAVHVEGVVLDEGNGVRQPLLLLLRTAAPAVDSCSSNLHLAFLQRNRPSESVLYCSTQPNHPDLSINRHRLPISLHPHNQPSKLDQHYRPLQLTESLLDRVKRGPQTKTP
jgi:hypothetical protein